MLKSIYNRKKDNGNFYFEIQHNNVDILIKKIDSSQNSFEKEEILWLNITQICIVVNDFHLSDMIYITTNQNNKKYSIPIEAVGGSDLMAELVTKKLLPDNFYQWYSQAQSGDVIVQKIIRNF